VERPQSRPRPSFWSSPLLRQRPNRLIDALLGAIVLAAVAGLIAGISPILAAVVVVAVVGLYLDGRRRQKRSRQARSALDL
jgi:hypothetical protein